MRKLETILKNGLRSGDLEYRADERPSKDSDLVDIKYLSDTVIYVDTQGDDANGGTSFSDAKKTVNGALSLIPKDLSNKLFIIALHPGTYAGVININGFYGKGEIRFQTFSQSLNDGTSKSSIFFRNGVIDPIRDDSCKVNFIHNAVLLNINTYGDTYSPKISFLGLDYESHTIKWLDKPFRLNSTGNTKLIRFITPGELFVYPSGIIFDATGNTKQSDWIDITIAKQTYYALDVIGDLNNGSTTGTAWNQAIWYGGNGINLSLINPFSEFSSYYKGSAPAKAFSFSGIRKIIAKGGNDYRTSKVNIELSSKFRDVHEFYNVEYLQGVLPDNDVPKINLKNTKGVVFSPTTFLDIVTDDKADLLVHTELLDYRVIPTPTTDPGVIGAFWKDNGTLKVN